MEKCINVFDPAAPSARGGQIKTRPFLLHVRQGRVDGGAAHRTFETGIGQRGGGAGARLLHRRIRQADDDDDRIPQPQLTSTSTGKASIPLTSAFVLNGRTTADRTADRTRASMGGYGTKAGARARRFMQ